MSWVDINIWIREVGGLLTGSIIDNIYSHREDLVLRLRLPGSEKRLLVVRPGYFVFTAPETLFEKSELSSSGTLVSLLRRYVRDCRISGLSQVPCERIVDIEIACGQTRYILTIELIPRGVVALRDENSRVLVSSSVLRTRDREVRPGTLYTYPPRARSVYCETDEKILVEGFLRGYDLVRGIVIGLGTPPDIAEEFVYRASLDKRERPRDYAHEKILYVIDGVRGLLREILERPSPCIVYDERGFPIDYYSFKPLSGGGACVERGSIDQVLREYYTPRILAEGGGEVAEYQRSLEKLSRDLEEIERELEDLLYIKSLLDNKYTVFEEVFQCYRESLRREDKKRECPSRVEGLSIEARGRELRIVFGERTLVLDLSREFIENYTEVAKRISQLERGRERIRETMRELREEIEERSREAEIVRRAREIRGMRETQWYERFHWIVTSEGLLAIGGRDSDQNEVIVRRYLEERDLFFHADIHGGSVFVLKNGVSAGETSIREVAHLAGCYSRAWREGLGYVDVFYVPGSQVSKSPPPGEYLPKGSFMIYGEKKWVRGVRLVLGIGIEIVDNRFPRVVVGDPDYIKKRAVVYALIAPGDMSPEEVSEEILRRWLERHRDLEVMIRAIDKEEILRRVPGRSRILSVS